VDDRIMAHGFRDEQDRVLAGKVMDKAGQALKRQGVVLTPFLDPHQQKVAETVLRQVPEITYYLSGGYPGAERVRLAVLPAYFQGGEQEMGLTYLRIEGDMRAHDISHRDVLGAVLALGIKREALGDILVEEEGAILIGTAEAAAFLLANLKQVRQTGVHVKIIEAGEFTPPAVKTKEVKGTVASLRLDAVASLGYSVSRTKMVSVIKADQVKVNWQPVKNPAAMVKEGDIISVSGRGRLEMVQVGGESRKGRLHIVVKKYL
jgi:RNA-binding protein YlmH